MSLGDDPPLLGLRSQRTVKAAYGRNQLVYITRGGDWISGWEVGTFGLAVFAQEWWINDDSVHGSFEVACVHMRLLYGS